MLGIWIGKLVTFFLHMRGLNATSFPGKVALRFSPGLITRFGKQLQRVVVVTGTNGKTTTTSLLSSMMQREETIVTNHRGANLVQGIATALLQHANWAGRLTAKTAILEVDEATLPNIARMLPIRVIVVTNVFRDQLDRYGELDTTVEKLFTGIRETDACLILNADDPLCRSLGLRASRKTFYYGMDRATALTTHRDQIRDGQFCLQCGHELNYAGFWYGQLGLYDCPHCDFVRPHPEFVGEYRGRTMILTEEELPPIELDMPVHGLYNAYNVLAASTSARVLGLWSEPIREGLSHFSAPDGRMQTFDTNPSVTLNLIKNPTGCDSVVQAVVTEPSPKVVVIGINDLAADGRDVSWLWDADFEWFAQTAGVIRFIVTGLRAEDMALRLKYAGVGRELITIEPTIEAAYQSALQAARVASAQVFALTTYTLLHRSVDILSAKAREHESNEKAAYRASVS